jgi:hypothetical protein
MQIQRQTQEELTFLLNITSLLLSCSADPQSLLIGGWAWQRFSLSVHTMDACLVLTFAHVKLGLAKYYS